MKEILEAKDTARPQRIVIFGSGGISREVAFLIEEITTYTDIRYEIVGFVERPGSSTTQTVSGYRVLKDVCELERLDVDCFALPVGDPTIKERILREEVSSAGKRLGAPNLIHHRTVFRRGYVEMGEGNILCAGTILTTDIRIGMFNLFNLNCTVGHDARIGNFTVINPGCNISGGVELGDKVYVGAGSTILQYVKVGDSAVIGAGAVVTEDIPAGTTVVGIPARPIRRKGNGIPV